MLGKGNRKSLPHYVNNYLSLKSIIADYSKSSYSEWTLLRTDYSCRTEVRPSVIPLFTKKSLSSYLFFESRGEGYCSESLFGFVISL